MPPSYSFRTDPQRGKEAFISKYGIRYVSVNRRIRLADLPHGILALRKRLKSLRQNGPTRDFMKMATRAPPKVS